jgi:hypothetical protein
MSICTHNGEEIAYASIECPACEEIEDIRKELKEEYDEELGNFELENDELRDQIEDLKDKYEVEV